MSDGHDRTDVPYIWPQTLRIQDQIKVVYLDLNHWVALAKAASGHRDGRAHVEILRSCLNAAQRGSAVFPLSDSIYLEINKIRQHRQRRDLRNVMEMLSNYRVVTSRSVVSTHEIEALLDASVGPNPQPINTVAYLDWGVARAFGMVGGFRVRSSDGRDVTAEARTSHPDGPDAFDRVFADAELELNRRVLDGPTDAEEPQLVELGWDPTSTMAIAEQRAAQEIDQVRRFDENPIWRAGRIRDVVAAREMFIETNAILYRSLKERGATLESSLPDPEAVRRAFDSMPSFDVAVTIKTSFHRDPNHRWRPNDVHDIDAMGSTIPYCDVVVTDKAMAFQVHRTGLADRFGTTVLSRLTDLPTHV